MADTITFLLGLLNLQALAAMGAAIVAIFALFVLVVYIYSSFALMAIAKKTKTKNAWMAWIPLANIYLMIQIAEVPWWTIFALLLPFIPVIGGLALCAASVWWWWKISENRNKPGWLGILMIIPFLNLIVMGILAWSD